MNGKDLEKLNEIDEFIKNFENEHTEFKARMTVTTKFTFYIDFKYGVPEPEQQEEVDLIEHEFSKKYKLENIGLIRIGKDNNIDVLDYSYAYKIS